MFCPRCGHDNDDGNRFCVSCGAELGEAAAGTGTGEEKPDAAGETAPAPAPSAGGGDKPSFFRRVVGTSKRERYITAGTAAALVIAVIAFFLLDTPEDDSSTDPFLKASDERCLAAKDQIEKVTTAAGTAGADATRVYADGLLRLVVQWRADQRELVPSAEQQPAADAYLTALLTLSNDLADLAELARGKPDRQALVAAATKADAATAAVEDEIDSMHLERCGALVFTPDGGSG